LKANVVIIRTFKATWEFDPEIVIDALGTEEPIDEDAIKGYIGDDAEEWINFCDSFSDVEETTSITTLILPEDDDSD
jgi:hypothetical protein